MKTLLLFSLVHLFLTGMVRAETTTTTTAPDTTDASTTTDVPTTTSPETPTTTEAPTTSSEAPITSTTDPTTNTTKDPVTTPPPVTTTKQPEPDECTFNVTQKNVTCIRADLKMSFIVSLEGKPYPLNLGCDAKYDLSDCSSNETQTLVLYESDYNLTMVFEKESGKFYVKDIVFGYKLPAGEGVVSSNTTKIFSVKTGNSYLCKTKSDVHLGNVTIEIAEIHVQAFLQKEDKNFGAADECEADDKVSDVVPIAVGIALAALIIIVLIAYLVGRRRSRQSGYQSV